MVNRAHAVDFCRRAAVWAGVGGAEWVLFKTVAGFFQNDKSGFGEGKGTERGGFVALVEAVRVE